MAHRTKKTEKLRENRGKTFNGFAPRIEDGKRQKLEKARKKYGYDENA